MYSFTRCLTASLSFRESATNRTFAQVYLRFPRKQTPFVNKERRS